MLAPEEQKTTWIKNYNNEKQTQELRKCNSVDPVKERANSPILFSSLEQISNSGYSLQ